MDRPLRGRDRRPWRALRWELPRAGSSRKREIWATGQSTKMRQKPKENGTRGIFDLRRMLDQCWKNIGCALLLVIRNISFFQSTKALAATKCIAAFLCFPMKHFFYQRMPIFFADALYIFSHATVPVLKTTCIFAKMLLQIGKHDPTARYFSIRFL